MQISAASYVPRPVPMPRLEAQTGAAPVPRRPPGRPPFVDPPAPVPTLARPVLLIAGGNGQRDSLPGVAHYLTAGGNNQYAGAWAADRRPQFEQSYRSHPGNVFAVHYTARFGSFEHNAGEIKEAIEDVRRLTGSDQVDVIAECKAALEMREYLKEGHDGVRNLVMVVPPNHGLPGAGDLARIIGRGVRLLHLPIRRIAGYPMDEDTVNGLAGFATDWNLGPIHDNPTLHGFNTKKNEAHESAVLHSLTVIGGEGQNLFAGPLGPGLPFPIMRGDHSVPNWSAFLRHAQNFFYDGDRAIHGQVKDHPQALAKMAECLVTDGAPVQDEHYVATAPTVGRVMARTAAWTAGFIGRASIAVHAVTGGMVGPLGATLGGIGAVLAVMDGTRELGEAARGAAPQGTAPAIAGGIGKLATAAGVALGLAGTGGILPLVLIGGGLVASVLTD